jgi:hypothetical protein
MYSSRPLTWRSAAELKVQSRGLPVVGVWAYPPGHVVQLLSRLSRAHLSV